MPKPQSQESSYLAKASDDSVVELARRYGAGVLEFLRDVLENKYLKLGQTKSLPLRDRLAAADLLRKFAAIPANVSLDLGVTQRIIYVGDDAVLEAEFKDVTPIKRSEAPLLREGVEADPDPVDSPQGSSEGNAVRRDSRRKSKREERLADK